MTNNDRPSLPVGTKVTYLNAKGTKSTGVIVRLVPHAWGTSYIVRTRNGAEVHVADVEVADAEEQGTYPAEREG